MTKYTPNLIAVFAILLSPLWANADAGSVTIDSGKIRGVEEKGIARYLGIPYAAAPVGELRWRRPQSVAPWDGVREASSMGHACAQPLGSYPEWADQALVAAGISEDCLTVNVWTPAKQGESLPVLFYIHGGTMQYGSNVMPTYDGAALAAEGFVVVVTNYRLGYLGRFAHPALSRLQADEPLLNYGLMDQIAALKWVQRNIAAFGGDRNNVTIFGHSAGGQSVNYLMVTPQSKGLFHKAIAQGSGLLVDVDPHITQSLPRGLVGLSGEQVGQMFAEHFEIPDGPDKQVVTDLRAVAWQDIVAYQGEKMMPFSAYVDGTMITDSVLRTFELGEQHDVPYITGTNSWELSPIATIPLIGKWFVGGEMIAGQNDEDLAIFADQWTRIGLGERWYEEGLFWMSTRYAAKQMVNVSSPAWQYRITYLPEAIRDEVPGAPHGYELVYMFNVVEEHPEWRRPKELLEYPVTVEDLAWGDKLRAYWLNFARTGNPNGPGLPHWPEYRPDTDQLMMMGDDFVPVNGLDKDRLDFLEERALIRRAEYGQAVSD